MDHGAFDRNIEDICNVDQRCNGWYMVADSIYFLVMHIPTITIDYAYF